ncbi:MAG: 50S ribosomal protein L3 [Chloroflexota bacterium]
MKGLSGLIGTKIGMIQIYEEGMPLGVTAIEAGPCFVSQVKTKDKDGYEAVQLAYGKAKRLNQPLKGHLKDVGQFKHLREFPADVGSAKVGQQVDVSLFKAGDRVTVVGISKGKGFAGVVKRYHFRGGPRTHGQSDRHRAPGSIGAGTSPGRVLKGKKMAGHMGHARTSVRGLRVAAVDAEKNLLLVKGAVPGANQGLVLIRKSGGLKS